MTAKDDKAQDEREGIRIVAIHPRCERLIAVGENDVHYLVPPMEEGQVAKLYATGFEVEDAIDWKP